MHKIAIACVLVLALTATASTEDKPKALTFGDLVKTHGVAIHGVSSIPAVIDRRYPTPAQGTVNRDTIILAAEPGTEKEAEDLIEAAFRLWTQMEVDNRCLVAIYLVAPDWRKASPQQAKGFPYQKRTHMGTHRLPWYARKIWTRGYVAAGPMTKKVARAALMTQPDPKKVKGGWSIGPTELQPEAREVPKVGGE